MESWHDFFVAEVGASAALAGLLFVAISINLESILKSGGLPGRALAAIVALLAALFAASVALLPASTTAVGIGEVLVGLAAWSGTTALQWSVVRALDKLYRVAYLRTVAVGQSATLLLALAGIIMLTSGNAGLYLLAAGIGLCYFDALIEAWVLLIEIRR